MSLKSHLQGSCQCGRNRYVINLPQDSNEAPRVFFDTTPTHSVFQATPLPAFIRVPLTWYQSVAIPFFDDETASNIRRAYTHHSEQHSKRSFCGFCGTPLSYWSEQPPSEAEYICLTLGSLSRGDLGDLEELGLLPDEVADAVEKNIPVRGANSTAGATSAAIAEGSGRERDDGHDSDSILAGRETLSLPWFDTIVAGSRLATMRMGSGAGSIRDGRVRVEWEVREWTSKDGDDAAAATGGGTEIPKKKQRLDDDADGGATEMEGVQRQ